MQIQPNFKNCLFFLVILFFIYLAYLLYFGDASSYQSLIHDKFSVDIRDLVNYCVLAAEIGGRAIVRVHQEKQTWKSAKSKDSLGADEFVTRADLISHQLIMENMLRAPGLNVVSEEKSTLEESEIDRYRSNNYLAWLKRRPVLKGVASQRYLLSDLTVWVDPLDATQEFTEDLLHFVTVMICVAVRGRPRFGVIHRPFMNETVWGLVGHGIYPADYSRSSADDDVTGPSSKQDANVALVSRSHAGRVRQLMTSALPSMRVEPAGGAGYKTLRVLNGTARLYLHTTRIKRWDVCAPSAIIAAVKGHATDLYGADLNFDEEKGPEMNQGLLITKQDHFTFLGKLTPLMDTKSLK